MNLQVTSIKWKDQKRFVDKGECHRIAVAVKNFYEKNSRSLIKFIIDYKVIKVDLNSSKHNLKEAERICKQGISDDTIHLIINNFERFTSHTTGNICHLRNGLIQTACHETGHVLDLGHSGSYMKTGRLDLYGDPQSVMGRFSSKWLNAPQLYYKGWLPEKEVIYYNGIDNTFTLKKINNFDQEGCSIVVIKREGRYICISYPSNGNNVLSLHLFNKGSSQLVRTFGKEFTDNRFTKLKITKTNYNKEKNTITFKIDQELLLENSDTQSLLHSM